MSFDNKLLPLANIPSEHQKSDAGTYLNLPYWSEFFIKEEFFNFLSNNKTKDFAYWENIKIYWVFYLLSYKLINKNDISLYIHFKLALNAIFFTSEYIFKFIYDTCFSLLRKKSIKTNKEELIDTINQDYLDFIKNNNWYEFDFLSRLIAYYKYPSIRTKLIKFTEIEKTAFLTVSFLFKQSVAKVIKVFNSINYMPSNKTIVVELDYFPENLEQNKEINVIGEYNKHILLEFPKHKGLKHYINKISLNNNLYTISGNKGVILVSCLFEDINKISLIKMIPIIRKENQLNNIRIIYPIPVNYLPGFIKYCHNKKINIEHILDY